jgi:hypothetical protein
MAAMNSAAVLEGAGLIATPEDCEDEALTAAPRHASSSQMQPNGRCKLTASREAR